MTNMMLKIEADTGKLDAKLRQADEGVRKLELAVRVGDRTMKSAVTTELQLAAAVEKFEGAAVKAATAQQRKAAASLAAQKSSALLKRLQDEERASLQALADAQAEAAKRERIALLGKDTMRRASTEAEEAAFRRTQKRLADMARAQEGQVTGWRRGVQGAATFAGSLGVIGAAAGAVSLALDEVGAAHERAMAKAKRSDSLANGMKDLVSALPEGEKGAAILKQITAVGAKHGLAPDATAQLAGPMYATADKSGDGALDKTEQASFDANLKAGALLSSTGVAVEDATNVLLAGDNKGVAGDATAAKLLKAAAISKRGPGEFSKSASAISQFDSLDTGMAVTTALSASELNAGRLPERVKDVQMALASNTDKGEFAKKHGLAGLSQGERIAKLRAAAVASGDVKKFTDQFTNQGLDEGKATSLAMLIQQGDLYSSAAKSIGGTGAGELAGAVSKIRDNPITGSAMRSAEAAAINAQAAVFGDEAPAAREERAAALARGAELQRYGGGRAVNEAGEEKAFDFTPWNILNKDNRDVIGGRFSAMMNGMPGTGLNPSGPNQDPKTTGFEKLEAQLAQLNETLAKNNEITAANTTASKSSKPVGGAASNAEEKY